MNYFAITFAVNAHGLCRFGLGLVVVQHQIDRALEATVRARGSRPRRKRNAEILASAAISASRRAKASITSSASTIRGSIGSINVQSFIDARRTGLLARALSYVDIR